MQDFRMETFLAVCRFMNYTKAAAALKLTQPAVSQHIRYLEQAYGVELFRKNGKKTQLTPAGEMLRKAALTMKHDEIHMKQKMKQVSDPTQSYLFGATLSVAQFMLPDDLGRFIRRHPHSYVRMLVANTKELLEKLDQGEVDFVIVEGDFLREEYDCLVYSQEEYVAVGNFQMAEKYEGACFEELLKERLILREKGSGTREILENCLKSRGITVNMLANPLEIGDIGAILELVKKGLGITFMYRAALKGKEGQLCVIPLKDFSVTHDIMFVFRKNSFFREDYERIYRELKNEFFQNNSYQINERI